MKIATHICEMAQFVTKIGFKGCSEDYSVTTVGKMLSIYFCFNERKNEVD